MGAAWARTGPGTVLATVGRPRALPTGWTLAYLSSVSLGVIHNAPLRFLGILVLGGPSGVP